MTSDLDRVASATHTDPHSYLGPHKTDAGVVVRVFHPEARSAVLVTDAGLRHGMQRLHDAGVFAVELPETALPLRYRVELALGKTTATIRDPYAFPPVLGEIDMHLAGEGKHLEIYQRLGAHVRELDGVRGTSFAVWAPAAKRVSVVGSFNNWDGRPHVMRRMGHGIWEIFLPDVGDGALYKYEIWTLQGLIALKADPYAAAMELRPRTAARVVERSYAFTDHAWMTERAAGDGRRKPMSIYEVHLGSWRLRPPALTSSPEQVPALPGPEPSAAQAPTRGEATEKATAPSRHLPSEEAPPPALEAAVAAPEEDRSAARFLSYRELAESLVDYVADLGFTHLELLPIMEHPFDGSWGYQVSGYFAPTSRHGSPDDFRYFIDRCHARGIGVILDWTPAHFPKDDFALGRFDGSALYEHLDPRRGEHKQWQTYIFNYGRTEVRNFLIANALYWFDEFHIDGLRVDAVASMLYLDYGTQAPGDWIPNEYGGHENLEAVALLRELNERVHARFPGALTMAEESTAWPAVTKPLYVGGLGFDFKWNMGWMHDTLEYFQHEPIHRSYHHNQLTYALWYAFQERFVLPLSHDEVVHLKRSLASKMPGDRWQKHANLRALYGYMWSHPGRKLLFMGGEFAQWREWNFESELDWFLLEENDHRGISRLIRDLNALYVRFPALYQLDEASEGFRWIDCNDVRQSVISYIRYPSPFGPKREGAKVATSTTPVVCVANFTPVPRKGYRMGVPRNCGYVEILNTDAADYGGSGLGNGGRVHADDTPYHGFKQSITLTLPPLAMLWFIPELDHDPNHPGPRFGG